MFLYIRRVRVGREWSTHLDAASERRPESLVNCGVSRRRDADVAIYNGHVLVDKYNEACTGTLRNRFTAMTIVEGHLHAGLTPKGMSPSFPPLLGLLGVKSPYQQHVFEFPSDHHKLSVPYGLQSLSLADAHYGKDEDYWRGAVYTTHLNVLKLGARDQTPRNHPTSAKLRAVSTAVNIRALGVCPGYNSCEDTRCIRE